MPKRDRKRERDREEGNERTLRATFNEPVFVLLLSPEMSFGSGFAISHANGFVISALEDSDFE